MKTITIILSLLLAGFMLVRCTKSESANPESTTVANPAPEIADPVKRGEYLVKTIGCDDCHSPKIMTDRGPVPDPERRMSGHPSDEALPKITDKSMIAPGQWALFSKSLTAAVGPWGVSFAANLTPDDTGIGSWSYSQFEKSIREGKNKGLDGGRMLLPPMPWPNFAQLNDVDLRAIFAYLKSIKPVQNVVPQPIPPTEL